MPNKKGTNCRNRNVVQVDHRLHSPFYDWNGDDGLALSSFEIVDSDAMCFWGMCDHKSYNAWVDATNDFIENKLIPHYKKTLGLAEAYFGGAPIRVDLMDRFNKIAEFIKSWDEANYRSDKKWYDEVTHPFSTYWRGEIRGIITYFDEAACYMDELNSIVSEDLKRPSAAVGAPIRTLEPSPTGSYLDGSGGGPRDNGGKKAAKTAVGVVALGAAAYFGYKILTE